MIRFKCLLALLAATLLFTGCSSSQRLETRSYQLQDRATEEPLILGILNDNRADLGRAIARNGGPVTSLEITSANTAIVRATPRAHDAIRRALDEARKDAATVDPDT